MASPVPSRATDICSPMARANSFPWNHWTMAFDTVSGVSGVKPCVKVKAGASAAELAVMDASTSCGRFSPSWLSLP